MPIEKMTEVPYPGVVPWLAVRKKINEIIEQGGSPITVDDALSSESENPVQNKVIYNALGGKADTTDLPDASELVPDTTGASQGDVLMIGADGPEWVSAGGSNDPVVFYYKSSNGKLYESDWATEVAPSDVYDWLIANPLTPALLVDDYYNTFYVAERWVYSNADNTTFYYSNGHFSGRYNTYSISNSGVYSSLDTRRVACIEGGSDVNLYIPKTALTVGATYTATISRNYYFSGRYFSKDFVRALVNGDITAKCIYMGWSEYQLKFTVVNSVTISDYNGGYIMTLNGSYMNSTGGEITAAGDLTFLYSNTSDGLQQNIEIDSKIEIGPITIWYSSSWITP